MDRFRLALLIAVEMSARVATSATPTLEDWRDQYCFEHVIASSFSESQGVILLGITNGAFRVLPQDVGVVVRKFVFPDKVTFEDIAAVEVLKVVESDGSIRLRRTDQRGWTIRAGDMVFLVLRRPWPRFKNWRANTEVMRCSSEKSVVPEPTTNLCRSGRFAAFIEYRPGGGGIGSSPFALKRAQEMRNIAEGRASRTATAITIRDLEGFVERRHPLPERLELAAGPFWGSSGQSIFCVFRSSGGAGARDVALWGKRIDDTSQWVKVLDIGEGCEVSLGLTSLALRQGSGADRAGRWFVGDIAWEESCPPVQSVDLGSIAHE